MASLPPPPSVVIPGSTTILGLPVHPIDLEGVVRLGVQAIADGTRLRIAVTNANKCYLAARDPELRAYLQAAELVVPETAVVWGARVLGRRGIEPVWGIVLAGRLLAEADRRGWSVYLVGARAEVVERAAAAVRARFPGLRLAGHHHGYLDDPGTRASVVAELARARPDLVLVGMGSPVQERFLSALPPEAAPRISIGVGGTFDVLAGVRESAPTWIRGTGLEWLWRSAQDPRLLARYLVVNPWFVGAVLRERLLGPPGSTRA
jgi:N-acetylglucosaminyldiphosphoundecaprenol N-acetyl-beta-D-mannosaminyltransferase